MNKHRIGALVAAAALTLTFAGTAFASHTVDLGESGTDKSGQCTGDYFKVEDAVVLEEGTHTYTGETKAGADFSVTLTVVFDEDDEVESITVVDSDPPIDLIVVKAGGDFFNTDGSSITPGNGKAISDISFCLGTTTTTTETTDTETTDTETTTTETTTSTETTDTETTSTETTDTETTSTETTDTETTDTETTDTETTDTETTDTVTTPSGSVEELTPPQTDTISQPTSSSSVSTGLLLVLAGILAAVLVVVPAAARSRR